MRAVAGRSSCATTTAPGAHGFPLDLLDVSAATPLMQKALAEASVDGIENLAQVRSWSVGQRRPGVIEPTAEVR
jgi:hypothetical protein